ncbi:MAG: B12-binding domain-containing radical SAM protein [Planctomycetes bacterium]|nr:B12-binding domain-containing radical SAM protein [Planctomycetota bacterium]
MKVMLVYPPQGHFTQPYLSIPSLAAYLRANGVKDVSVLDLNIDAYDSFLTKARLTRSLERVRAGEGLASLEARESLGFSEMERYQLLSEIALSGDEVASRIEEAKTVLRDRNQFYDYQRYLWAGRTLEQGLRLFSAEYAPTKLSAHGFVMRKRIERSSDIVAAIDDELENPYLEYFRERAMPRIRELDPDVIGISVTFPSQAIPVMTLCKLLKQWKPTVHITLGGGLLAYVAEKLAKRPEVWSLIDSFVLLEGEGPLLRLIQELDAKKNLSKIPNLLWCDEHGSVQKNDQTEPLDIKTLPTPDFGDLPLEKYFSPELVLPLAATRGCYWGKCVFCTLYTVIGPGYRGRTTEQTVDDMRILKERHGVKNFYLAIEDLPPNMAKAFPREILNQKLGVHWWADARLEHEHFTRDVLDDMRGSGCVRLAFGFESSNNRVLDRMCKGIDAAKSVELIRRVHDAGISVTLYVMIGFPTETREEARGTLRTIVENERWIQEVSVRVFYLDERSEIFARRAEFDIAEIFPDADADLQVYYDFRTSSGMSRREARDAYLEFTRTLRSHFPVFQNTNMLYHELKSHYFLYLVRHGSWQALKDEVLDRPATPNVPAVPQRSTRLVTRELAFDRGEIDRRLGAIDSFTLRPRYQSDLIDDDDRARLDGELPREARSPSTLIYDRASGELRAITPDVAELLDRCDGARTLEQVVEVVPQPHRDAALACVREMAQAGMLEAKELVR